MGYHAVQVPRRFDLQQALTALSGLLLVLGFVGVHPVIPYLSIAAGAVYALRSTWESLREREIDVNLLMVMAAAGAIVAGYPLDAAILLFLFSLSGTLESLALGKAKSAIASLMRLRPQEATLVEEAGDRVVRLEEVLIGSLLRVRPFDAIPLDGEVVEGMTTIDESTMTGESRPRSRGPGDSVVGGTLNQEGTILIRTTTRAGEATLDRIVRLVREAQDNKASGERISAWFGKRYTVFVVAVFGLSFTVRLALGQGFDDSLYPSLTLLVALSPCALVISTPAATLSALAWAARNGLLVRGGAAIEAAGEVDAVALDKTGTLTAGTPEVVAICQVEIPALAGVSNGDKPPCWRAGDPQTHETRRWLAIAAAVEQFSPHPLAAAVVRAAQSAGITPRPADESRTLPGLGVEAIVDGRRTRMGRQRMFDGEPLSDDFVAHIEDMRSQGWTVSILEHDGQRVAFGFADSIRPEASQTIQDLHALGIRQVTMLTGDNEITAVAVARQVGINDVQASLLPDQKSAVLRRQAGEGWKVMMVGDGVNDAPSLAQAHVGVAMGGLGSDVALEAADVVLMRDNLRGLPDLVRLGRQTRAVIRANLLFAGVVVVGLAVASLAIRLPLPIAVLGHESSTVLVILNGLRLLRGPRKGLGRAA